MERKKLLVIDRRSFIIAVTVGLILALMANNFVANSIESAYSKGYTRGTQQVFDVMLRSAAPSCNIMRVIDVNLVEPIQFVDINCTTKE